MSDPNRIPPQNLGAELGVLGSCLVDCSGQAIADVVNVLNPADFYSPDNQAIYKAVLSLWDAGQPVDLITLSGALKASDALDRIGGTGYLTELLERTPSAANAEHYANIVAGHARRRRIIQATSSASVAAYDLSVPVDDVADAAVHGIIEATQDGKDDEMQSVGSVLQALFDGDGNIAPQSGEAVCYPELNELMNGLTRGQMLLLAARPSVGKTTFALNLASGLAIGPKHWPVVFFSMEMGRNELSLNLLAGWCGFNCHSLRRGYLNAPLATPEAKAAAKSVCDAPILIDDTWGLNLRRLRGKLMALKNRDPRTLVAVIDYLQLMEPPKAENATQEVSQISRGLKAIAKELDVAMIVLSQLSRATEAREGRVPHMSDLRQSGSLEQDADKIILLYRPDLDPSDPSSESSPCRCEAILAKHRNGPTGKVEFSFDKRCLRFDEAVAAPNF